MNFPVKRCAPVLLLFIFATTVKAQMIVGLNTDSLKMRLRTMPADSNKVHTLIRMGQQYENNAADTAIYYYDQARALSIGIGYHAGFAHYVNNYSAVLNVQGKFDESLALNLRSTDTCRRYGLTSLLIKALINTGVVYQYRDEYEKAAKYYLEAMPMLEQENNTAMLSIQYGNLCGLYRNLEQPLKALQYARLALSYAEKTNDLTLTGAACNNLGNALHDAGSTAAAIPHIRRAYNIGKTTNDLNMQETALINLGNTYNRAKDADAYLPVYKSALPLAETLEDVSGKTIALKGIAEGLYWKKQYQAAAATLDTLIPFAFENSQLHMGAGLLMLMSDVQIALGNPALSLLYRERYDSLQAAHLNELLVKNVQELETKYKVERQQHALLQKDLQLAARQKEALRQRFWLLVTVAGLLILMVSLYSGYRFFRHKRQLDRQAMEALIAEQENLRLRAKIDGQNQERLRISQEMHDDMGSGLTSILFLSRMMPPAEPAAEKIQHTAGGLVRKMNEIIWSMNPGQDSLDSLLAHIRVNTAELLAHAGLEYHFDIMPDVPDIVLGQAFRRHMYLAVKEAVHNVVKHAAASRVDITIRTNGELAINIRDNGKGYDPAHGRPFGNGLNNLRLRMEQIGGKFEITAAAGTIVSLTGPLPL